MNTTQYSLALSGINCGRCVAKIVDGLRERDPDVSFTINDTKNRAELITTLLPESAIEVLAKLGYAASIPTQQEYRTSVSNVTCQHCVGKITQAIGALDGAAQVVVDLENQTLVVNSSLNGNDIESVLVELGYSGMTDDTQPQTTDVIKSNKVKTTQALDVSIELSLIGVTCASCVNTIEGALISVSGVDSVDVNFANRTATVVSSQPASVLIEAIQGAGYDAEEIVDQALASDLKEERESEEYRFKVKQSVIGLGLGVPLMVYGLFGGPMNVNTQSEQLLWLALGLVTFFILVRAGKHFFTGAWNATRRLAAAHPSRTASYPQWR